MDRNSTALFIGHRDCYSLTPEDIKPAIEEAIKSGITTFLNGGMGHFDEISAVAVSELKPQYPNIELLWIKPYPSQKVSYSDLFDDSSLYAFDWHIDNVGPRKAIPERNEYMVQQSSVAICHIKHRSSGAFKTYMKAKDRGLKIIEI